MDERVYKIALVLLQGIGIIKTKTLVSYAGGAKAVFTATTNELAKIAKISISRVKKLNREAALIRAQTEITFIEKNKVNIHYYKDPNYPASLKFCPDGPIVLFSKGNISFAYENIAIVGMRKATPYGKEITQKFVKNLTKHNVQIISGLAYGIDKEAHEAAIKNALPTIAVLGHGLDLIYPAAHKQLAQKMFENGGLVTEFLSNTPGDPSNFPRRNRIVAGLSVATIVIESAISGGSLITANLAFDYDRTVCAFPGNIGKMSSEGCNLLIRKNKAHLITNTENFLELMNWEIDESSPEIQTDLFDNLDVNEEPIINYLNTEKKAIHIDEIGNHLNLPLSELSLHLFHLEMRGTVQSLPGNLYQTA